MTAELQPLYLSATLRTSLPPGPPALYIDRTWRGYLVPGAGAFASEFFYAPAGIEPQCLWRLTPERLLGLGGRLGDVRKREADCRSRLAAALTDAERAAAEHDLRCVQERVALMRSRLKPLHEWMTATRPGLDLSRVVPEALPAPPVLPDVPRVLAVGDEWHGGGAPQRTRGASGSRAA